MPEGTGRDVSGDGDTPEPSAEAADVTRIMPRALGPGDVVGHFEIVQPLGQGGFGTVFEARNVHHRDERVVVKLLRPDTQDRAAFAEMLKAEASALQRVKHDAVVQYRTFGQLPPGDEAYLAVEFVDGPTLGAWRRSNAPDEAALRRLALRLADGLGAAHAQGVVHRDVSPDNIVLPGGDLARATLIDFSIAKQRGLDPLARSFGGKMSWAAPEQFDPSLGEIGPWTDFYALGLVLAFAARGAKLPLGGETFAEALEKRAQVPPLDGLPDWLKPALRRLLSPSPAGRPRTAEGVAALFEEKAPPPKVVVRDAARPPPNEPLRLPVAALGVAALALAVAVGAIAWFAIRDPAPSSSPPPAAVATTAEAPAPKPAEPASAPLALPPAVAPPDATPAPPAPPEPIPGPAAAPAPDDPLVARIVAELGDLGPEVVAAARKGDKGEALRRLGERRDTVLGGDDDRIAARLYAAACDLGSAVACRRLGELWRAGAGVAQDAAKAASYFDRACQGGDPTGCVNLGFAYDSGDGAPQDSAAAVNLWRDACDVGELVGCNALGVAFELGRGVQQDFGEAARLYRRACDGGVMVACLNLGLAYQGGRGVPIDLARAAQNFQFACDGGVMQACLELGIAYQNGEGVEVDDARAAHLYRKACQGSEAWGCINLAAFYEAGAGGLPADVDSAIGLYRRALELDPANEEAKARLKALGVAP